MQSGFYYAQIFEAYFPFSFSLFSFPCKERNRFVADRKSTLLTNILHKESCTELDLRGVDVYLRVHLTAMVCTHRHQKGGERNGKEKGRKEGSHVKKECELNTVVRKRGKQDKKRRRAQWSETKGTMTKIETTKAKLRNARVGRQ